MGGDRRADRAHPRRHDARAHHRLIAGAAALLAGWASLEPALAAPRVMSFDQCADQYVLALSPREAIVGLSTKADDADSLMRAKALGLPQRRPDLETALAARPQLVVRTYGGDPRLVRALERRGVRVLTLDDSPTFDGIRRNIRHVAEAVGEPAGGEALVARMDASLARSAGAWRGRTALYLTPSGFTAGPGTLVDEILRAAGLRNAERQPGYGELSVEQLALDPPAAVVLGFFDTQLYASESWAPARHSVLQRVLRRRTVATVPGVLISCADWAAADAVALIAGRAPR